MPLINTATKIYRGTSLATKVYRGTVQVWPPAATYGPNQTIYTAQTPGSAASIVGAVGNDVTFAVAGRVTGMRYWRGSAATQTSRTLRLWAIGGTLLATCATTGDAAPVGWKQALFTTPLIVTAGQTLRMAMDITPADSQPRSGNFASDIVSGDLTMNKQGYSSGAVPGAFPGTVNGFTYWVDVIFQKAL